tara:strand:- start:249 stop:1349 length:1101 start_codon:yes stop_codon:yes gene_type:complete
MVLQNRINFIKKVSLLLFIFSFLSLILSLWLQNTLVNFKYTDSLSDKKIKNSKFYSEKINCSKNIEDCKKPYLNQLFVAQKLGDCYIYNYKRELIVDGKKIKRLDLFQKNPEGKLKNLKPEFIDKDIEVRILGYDKNDRCIKNSKNYYLYKIFPFYYEFLHSLKKNPKTQLGSAQIINPFIYGETSISNIVKRFPINYIFKSFLFISVIFMYFYWINYKSLFIEILKSKNNKFVYFGLASAIFLFFHVLLLGVEFDSKIFKMIRKLIIVLFILSEIIAQFYLSIKLFKNKENLSNFCNTYIINIKLFFVVTVGLISSLVVAILLIYDLSSKVDYILEWNYFAGLLFYYFLSFMMWKKQLIINPSTT